MSSIDKGVEQVVNRLGKNVRVVKRGNTIYGYMNGEVVFSLADRYGYIRSDEEAIVENGIRRYEEEERRRRARRAEEKRAREEAVRRAKEESERQRQLRLEEERREAYNALTAQVSSKRRELEDRVKDARASISSVNAGIEKRKALLKTVEGYSTGLNLEEYRRKTALAETSQRAAVDMDVVRGQDALSEFNALVKPINANMTTEDYKKLNKSVKKIHTAPLNVGTGVYENQSAIEELEWLESHVKALLPSIAELKKISGDNGECADVARHALSELGKIKVTELSDVADASSMLSLSLTRIVELKEAAREDGIKAEISRLRGAIAACQSTYELIAEGTYTAKDHREEIKARAERLIGEYKSLREAEYTVCEEGRIRKVTERLTEMVERAERGTESLEEIDRLESELTGYREADKLHLAEYEEYLGILKELSEYGVDTGRIAPFSPKNYAKEKEELSMLLASSRRDFERSNLIVTDLEVKNVMEDMGYELFSSVGDSEGYVREALFTRRGYDGVLWQTVVTANGSVTRRVIGVNKGETETDPEYIKAVGKEMEAAHEPEAFLKHLSNALDSDIAVSQAVDHDTPGSDETIRRNGYHYLSGEALSEYEKRVAEVPTHDMPVEKAEEIKRTAAKRTTQRRVVKGKGVGSTQNALGEIMQKSRAMSYAN